MRNALRVLASVLALCLIVGSIAQAQTAPKPSAASQSQQARNEFVRAYKIGPEDLLSISVFEVPELNTKVRVSQDGTISLPLVGRVDINGLTQEEAADKLKKLLLNGYVKNPQVTVFIDEYKSQQVAIMGAVQNPASYPLIGRKNLLQMLSAAGGLTDQAGNQAFILREGPDGAPLTIPIDLDDLIVNNNQELNIPIEPKDTISVPIDREIRVFVSGRVNQAGPVTAKLSRGITLLQAIAGAQGLAQGAKQSAIMIKRVDSKGQEVRFKVNLKDIIKGKKKDIKLQDGDVVHVPESFW